jgi:molybdate transport system substrate-binding protein
MPPIPEELQPGFSFAGAVTSNSLQPEVAASLIRFLSASNVAKVISTAGLIPPKDR